MALAPKFQGHRLLLASDPKTLSVAEPLHTIEVYLDYVCPYSAKLFNAVYNTVAPAIKADPSLASKVQFIFRHQVQPWHTSSTLAHEAGVAVQRLAPAKFWAFSDALMKAQREYFDEAVVDEPRNETYRRLAKLAAQSVGLDEAAVYEQLVVPGLNGAPAKDAKNAGNQVTNDLKVVIKMARLVGVHVSPTVIFDGVVANDISSGWTLEQWMEWLKNNVA